MNVITETAQPYTQLPAAKRALTIVIAGNPNAGKTSLFNSLTGLRQKVANYPGVTVERKEGLWSLNHALPAARLIDLPGLYSLEAAALDEQIARDVITGKTFGLPEPDCIIAVADATNLERNLYLVTQLMEFRKPLVIALTMVDLAEKAGIEVKAVELSIALGIPVVPVVAAERKGASELAQQVITAVREKSARAEQWKLSQIAEREINSLIETSTHRDRFIALRELYDDELPHDSDRRKAILASRARLAEYNNEWWQEPLRARYRWIEQAVQKSVRRKNIFDRSRNEQIDRILTHRFFGLIILLAVMLLIFQLIFTWAQLPMDLIDHGFAMLGNLLHNELPAGPLTDLLADGIVAGVGAVLVFLPQIILLFLFITILEDTGYMARAAFMLDRLMRGVGLHGKAFLPLISSFACAIPGIMATRTIENPKDRLATIMIAPFMSCSARLPIYTLMIAAFFAGRNLFGFISLGAIIILLMYLLGILVAVCVAWILKHTILKAPPPPLIMEMPPYRLPRPLTILQTITSRSSLFVKRAGTVILSISIILWALAAFPRYAPPIDASANNESQATKSGAQLRQSLAGRAGRFIEPAIAPLGFDWKMGVGLIAAFAARETVVSTFSIIYNVGDDAGAESSSLIDAVRNARREDGQPAWTPLVAVSMMVFFVLACQCMSTVAIVRRETNSWKWPLFMVGYMTVVAYAASLIVFQSGKALGLS